MTHRYKLGQYIFINGMYGENIPAIINWQFYSIVGNLPFYNVKVGQYDVNNVSETRIKERNDNMEFKIGEVVQLASGGPKMTIGEIQGDLITCVRFLPDNFSMRTDTFISGVLVKVIDNKDGDFIYSDNGITCVVNGRRQVV